MVYTVYLTLFLRFQMVICKKKMFNTLIGKVILLLFWTIFKKQNILLG